MEEHRRYRPHLTLARSRDGADLTPCVTALEGFAAPAWTVVSCVSSAATAGRRARRAAPTTRRWPFGRWGRAPGRAAAG